MASANWVPLCFAGYDALDMRRGVPAPGPTGSPSTLIVLATWKSRLALLLGGCGLWCAAGAAAVMIVQAARAVRLAAATVTTRAGLR